MRKSTKEWIEEAKIIHGETYDYSLVDYKYALNKVKIICPIHGEFLQKANDHLNGHGCDACGGTYKKTTKIFIEEAKLVHGDKYDYSKVDYTTCHNKVKIFCPIHGEFLQAPISHLKNKGCASCSGRKKLTTSDFIVKANLVHSKKYDYYLVDYVNNKSKVKIICPSHGEFLQTPKDHLNGAGCPSCCESKGEKEIARLLTEMNLEFKREYKFEDCRNKISLPFDFYIPSINAAIEFQGEQHFKSIKRWGDEEGFVYRQNNDRIKKEYCSENNILLVEVRFDEKDIKNYLSASITARMEEYLVRP